MQCSDISIKISTASAVVVAFRVICKVLAIPQAELHSMFDKKTLVGMAVGHGEYEDRRGGEVTLHSVPSFVKKIPELGANYFVVTVCEESADIRMEGRASPMTSMCYILFKVKTEQISTITDNLNNGLFTNSLTINTVKFDVLLYLVLL